MLKAQSQADKAFDQVVEWLEHFEPLEDPRQSGKVWYRLDEVLLLCLLAVLAGAESWVEVAEFGKRKLAFLRRFRPCENGTPSHDQLGDLFAALDAEQFQRCFIAWVGSLATLGPDLVAIDGKTLRRSYQEGGGKAPIHMISAWANRQRLVLGQIKVADKSNEITAIPDLLDLLTLKGSTVTIDAMGCQREIAAKIIEKEADFVLARTHQDLAFIVRNEGGTVALDVETPMGVEEQFVADEVAREAIAFAATQTTFDVRDLPGDLSSEERVTIGEALEESGLFTRVHT